jgi:DnaJ-class molecular chaperone
MTTAEKIIEDCSGDRSLQVYALSNALTVTEKERDAISGTCNQIAANHALTLAENERLREWQRKIRADYVCPDCEAAAARSASPDAHVCHACDGTGIVYS